VKRKKTSSFAALVPLWAGLLILGSPALSLAAADDNTGKLQVQVEGGLVSLIAHEVPLDIIVQEIAVKADLRLVQHVVLDRVVSLTIERQTLPDVLDEILEDDSYQLYQGVSGEDDSDADEAVPGGLWIFSEGSALAPEATMFFEAVIYQGTVGEKREAIRELRRLGTPSAIQTLSLALSDDDTRVSNAAMEALSRIGGDEALAAIASASMDEDSRVRGKAAYAMAMAGGYSSTEYLKMALQDEDPRVRVSVIDSLGDIGDDYSIRVIQRALQDPDIEVRERALEVLDELESDAAFQALFPAD